MRITLLAIVTMLVFVPTAFAQRDAPVWEAYLPKFSIDHENTDTQRAITVDFFFKKDGGPHEHTEHQAYVLVYLKKDEEQILKLAADTELTKKENEKTKLFLDLLIEKKLVTPLDSKVAKKGKTVRFPDEAGRTPDRDGIDESGFPFKFTFAYETLFQSVQKLGNFQIDKVNVVGSSTWFDDKFKLLVFIPVNDSRHATKVHPKMREMYDFANVMDFKTALLYFRPLPYEFQFKKYDKNLLIYIN